MVAAALGCGVEAQSAEQDWEANRRGAARSSGDMRVRARRAIAGGSVSLMMPAARAHERRIETHSPRAARHSPAHRTSAWRQGRQQSCRHGDQRNSGGRLGRDVPTRYFLFRARSAEELACLLRPWARRSTPPSGPPGRGLA